MAAAQVIESGDFDYWERKLTISQSKRLERLEREHGDNAIVIGWDDSRPRNQGPIVLILGDVGLQTILRSGYLAVCMRDGLGNSKGEIVK